MMHVSASVYSQSEKITVKEKGISLSDLLWKIQSKTDFIFAFSADKVEPYAELSVDVEGNVEEVLDAILKDTNLDYEIKNGVYVIKYKKVDTIRLQPQKKVTITGVVTDSEGAPLPGTNVILKNFGTGTITDVNGEFRLDVDGPETVLIITFIGFETKELVVGDRTELKIQLVDSLNELGEVLVTTGYQNIKKDRMTGSVSTINAKTIQESGVTSMDQVLKGQLAGVSVMNTSGRPGASAQIRIRGLNSITGSMEPVWIVDGMEMQGAVPSVNVGGASLSTTIFTDGIANIPPEDIKSITVLKDAAATALYGARAANGVIVVETKKGTAGETYISASTSFGISEAPINHLDMMSSAEKVQFEKNLYSDFGGYDFRGRAFLIYQEMDINPGFREEGEAMLQSLRNTNTNWFDEIFRTGQSQRYNFTMSGGDLKTQYYASANLTKDKGILIGNEYTNFSGNMTITHRPNEKLKLEGNIRSGIRMDEFPNTMVDPFYYATYANAYEKPYNADGSYAYDRTFQSGINYYTNDYQYNYNMLEDLNSGSNDSRATSTDFKGLLSWDVTKGLNFESQIGYSFSSDHSESWDEPGSANSLARSWAAASGLFDQVGADMNNGYLRESTGHNTAWTLKNILKYNYANKGHFVNILMGQEVASRKVRMFSSLLPEYYPEYQGGGYPENLPVDYEDLRLELLGGSARDQMKSSSFFGSASYSYEDKYVASASVRYDGVDIVGNVNQFSPLWNASAKWNIHKEKFLQGASFLDILSVRFSYGYTGSIDHSALPFTTIKYDAVTKYAGVVIPTNINWKNPSVKWQTKLDRNLGLDFSVLNNRISGEFNYYNNRIEDILDSQRLPVSSGQKSVRANVATISNQGYELSFSTVNIDYKGFRWTTNFNIALNESMIVDSYVKDFNELPIIHRTASNSIPKYYMTGYDVSSWFGYEFAGVDPVTGNSLVYVQNDATVNDWEVHSEKDGRKIMDMDENFNHEATVSYLGKQYPPTAGGFGTTFIYKSLSLSGQFTFMTGHKIKTPRNYSSTSSGASHMDTNLLREDLNSWREPGDITHIPEIRTTYLQNSYANRMFDTELENGDFLKLSYINLNYYLPREWVSTIGLQRAKVTFSANNVFTWTKYKGIDPENLGTFGYPSARQYKVSLNLNF